MECTRRSCVFWARFATIPLVLLLDLASQAQAIQPAIAITYPHEEYALVSKSTPIELKVTVPLRSVRVLIDDHYVASGPPYTMRWDTTKVRNGLHALTAEGVLDSRSRAGDQPTISRPLEVASSARWVRVGNRHKSLATATPNPSTPTPVTTPDPPTPTPITTPDPPTATPSPSVSVSSLTLVDADNFQPISQYNPISNGATINRATLPTQNVTIRANTSPATVGSVAFDMINSGYLNTADTAPYYLCGSNPCSNLGVGLYSLSATAYSGANKSGGAGGSTSISFSVVDPTPTPISTPLANPAPNITATNCPTSGIVTPTGGALCSANGGPIKCPTSTNWKNPMDYGAVGDGTHDDSAAIQAANNAGDVCFPSGHTFMTSIRTGTGGVINITQNNKHWQAGMIGGAAPKILEPAPSGSCPTSGDCDLVTIHGNTGGSIIGLDMEAPASNYPHYNEWDMGIFEIGGGGNYLFAGNTVKYFAGDGQIEVQGTSNGSACVTGDRIAYNIFGYSGNYGYVVIAGQNNAADHNQSTECGEGVENDNTTECTGGNTFDLETMTVNQGSSWNIAHPSAGTDTCLTGGAAAGANYSGNTVSNSIVTGSKSCIYESAVGGGQPAHYFNNICDAGCVIH